MIDSLPKICFKKCRWADTCIFTHVYTRRLSKIVLLCSAGCLLDFDREPRLCFLVILLRHYIYTRTLCRQQDSIISELLPTDSCIRMFHYCSHLGNLQQKQRSVNASARLLRHKATFTSLSARLSNCSSSSSRRWPACSADSDIWPR